MPRKQQILPNFPDAPETPIPCPADEANPAPSLCEFSATHAALSISEAADKISAASKRINLAMANCGKVEQTFEIYKTGCELLIDRLTKLSSNLKEVMEAAHQPVLAGLSDDAINTINAIPGNITKAVTDEIGHAIRGKICHEVREGFKDFERQRNVCPVPWPIVVPAVILFLALIVFTILVVKEAIHLGLDPVLSIFSSCLGWFALVMVVIAIIYCIWLSCR